MWSSVREKPRELQIGDVNITQVEMFKYFLTQKGICDTEIATRTELSIETCQKLNKILRN